MNHTEKTDFLGKDRIFPLLLKMGIPAAVGMIVNALYNIVDTIFVGQGVGPMAIAALSIVFPLQMIVSAIAQALGVGTASIVSRRLGEKRTKNAAEAVGTVYSAIVLVTLALVAVVFVFMRPILVFFGATENILPYAMEYTEIVAIGFFFFALSMAASNLIRAEGSAKTAMAGMVLGALLNCILDPLLIFVIRLGVKGAALATVISQAVSCVYFLSYYILKRTHLPLKREDFRIRLPVLRESAVLGIPAFVQSAGLSILILVINTTLGSIGGDRSISTYGMINRLLTLIIFPIIGITQGFQPIAGYNYGARRFDRVLASLWTTILTVLGISAVGYAIVMVFPRGCMALFTTDPDLILSSARVLRIMALFVPLAAIQIAGSNYFQAIGKKTPSLILGLSRQFLILIPLVLILPNFFGVFGVWYAFPLSDLLATAITAILLATELRRLIREHEVEPSR